jgi:hypothetical protein
MNTHIDICALLEMKKKKKENAKYQNYILFSGRAKRITEP